jgi:MYXO-CTERM domain-containing protein
MKTVFAFATVLFLAAAAAAAPVGYEAFLDGASEAPPTGSPGTGYALAIIDTATHTLFVRASFSGLTGTTTAAHIHCCVAVPFVGTAGVATQTPSFSGFPLGVSSGSFSNTYDLTLSTSWNAAFITANGGTPASAETAFAAGLAAGRTYFNVHSTVNPGGEIRGFMVTPEPGTWLLAAAALAGFALRRRRR